MNWSPKNIVFVMFAGGWLVISMVMLAKGQQPPAPPLQILPLLEAPPYYGPSSADRGPYYGRPGEAPRAARAPAPRGEREKLPAYDPDFGTLAVSPGDECYGQNCRVQSLTGSPAVLFANLPTCDASKVGQMRYTTDQGWVQCSGTAPWVGFGSSSSTEPFTAILPLSLYDDGGTVAISTANPEELWSAACITCTTDLNFIGPIATSDAHAFNRIQCNWETAGAGGTTNAQIQIYDVTSAGELCSCNIGACNTASRTPLTCNCAATTVAGHLTVMRYKSKGDCAAAPQVTMCTAH